MAFKFDPNLDYQNDAIASVTNLFSGQEIGHSNFTIYDPRNYNYQTSLDGITQTEIGIANKLLLDEEDILKNLQKIQKQNHLKQCERLPSGEYNFAVEMETGTGKTYVYLKSIFELRKKFGFRKFIILVPSVAIREGVRSSIKMLEKHFKIHYPEFLVHSFQYSSDHLTELLEFARSDKIEIMIMTIQSLDSEKKVLNSKNQKHLEKTNGVVPIDVINRTNPIVIIDEPQSTSGSKSRKEYINKLNPLCTLQYSATHKIEKNVHKVYRLSSVDAYIKELVKQIEVASVIPKNNHNYAYVKLIEVKSKKNKMTLKIEIDKRNKTGVIERKIVPASVNDGLYELSGRRELYQNMQINRIKMDGETQSIEINNKELKIGESINSFDVDLLRRTQIRKTIKEHFEKEVKLNKKGIKVLSLFFIDKVANYRSWDGDNQIDGKFLKWFEEEYEQIKKEYADNPNIYSIDTPVNKVHEAYFAEDKKNHYKNTKGESKDDIKAYESIMKDKEYLLSFDNPIRFIFSHSALREGWDNPNVFQICTLNESAKSNDRKRQEIGRGLRLCVNQTGDRIFGFETNTLTVMANQSYEDFAKQLQIETEKDEGFKFGQIEINSFSGIPIISNDGKVIKMKEDESKEIYSYCRKEGYIDIDGNTTEKLRTALRDNIFTIPDSTKKYLWEITEYLKQVCGSLNIKDADAERIKYGYNKNITENNPVFIELWNRIKNKTKYSVKYDTRILIDACVRKIRQLQTEGIEIEYRKAKIYKNTTGNVTVPTVLDYDYVDNRNRYLPDIISFLQNSTKLTRKTVTDILFESKTLYMFYINPQRYMTDVANIINEVLMDFVLEGIKYTKIDNQEFYLQEVFPNEEKEALVEELVKSNRSVYEYNRFDSKIEQKFAQSLQDDPNVIVYTKLPTKKFTVPTPLGDYTPDWAIVMNDQGQKKLYFIIETKGTNAVDEYGNIHEKNLRGTEHMKILCGMKRFDDVGGAGYIVASNQENFNRAIKKYNDDGNKTRITEK